ncbi:hypothetical protein OTC26_011240 [Streptomyces tirandamycinicus]
MADNKELSGLVHGAVDAREQSVVDGKLAAGKAAEEDTVKGHAGLGLG